MDKYDYDKLFLKQASLGYSNLMHRYYRKNPKEKLRERQHLLDNDFVFSEDTIKRLSDINTLLAEKSEAAYQQAERLENDVLALMQNNDSFISDYEIGFDVSLFSERKYSNIPDLQGNPFFQWEPMSFYKTKTEKETDNSEHKDWLFKTDHRESIHEGNPLSGFRHSYLFHELTDHTILSLQDIVDIEDIWFEVILRIQNFQEIHQ